MKHILSIYSKYKQTVPLLLLEKDISEEETNALQEKINKLELEEIP